MELRDYWKALRRRWMLALIPAVIVLLLGLATYRPAPLLYNVGVRFIVGQPPSPGAAANDEQRYYNWLTSEYIVNGLNDWVRGGNFALAVSEHLAAQGISVPPGAIQAGLAADNARSLLTLSLNGNDPVVLEQMLNSAVAVMTGQNAQALPQLGGETAVLVQLDAPVVNQIPGGVRSQLDLPLRVAVALVVGSGLAILAEYLDPTIRERRELERIGLPVLGEIPREKRRLEIRDSNL
jgi:capsular polysaccharide biosynthesis protein